MLVIFYPNRSKWAVRNAECMIFSILKLSAVLCKLIKNVQIIINALRTGHEMLTIKDHSGNTGNALLCPEFLLLAYLIRKPLIG